MDNNEEDNNSMSDLEAAWDQHDAETTETEAQEEPLEATSEESTEQEANTEVQADAGPDADIRGDATGSETDGDGVQGGTGEVEAEEDFRPPVSWKAGAREHWKKLPKEVKEEIARREQDMTVGMRRNSESAQRGSQYDQIMNKYQSMFAATGQTPFQAAETVMQTASMLQSGTPGHKAQVVVDIIKQYGIDVSAIDNLLVGEPMNPQMAQQSAVEQAVQQAVAPYQQHMQNLKAAQQRAQQGIQHTANTEVDSFSQNPANEFYMDVREDMADLMDLAANRGRELTLDQAYQRACAARPDISGVVQSRNNAQTIADKRRASSTVSGGPGGNSVDAEPQDIRGAISQAWDNAGRV